MAGPRAFVSFDYDHDEMLRKFLVGQAHNERSPFEMADWSVKEHLTGDWKEKARDRIRKVDKVLVICGEHTDTATGVSAEVRIAREEGKPVHFIRGKKDKDCKLPKVALPRDRMIPWTWPNLRTVLAVPTPRTQPVMPKPASPRQPRVQIAPLASGARTPSTRTPSTRTPSTRTPSTRTPSTRTPSTRTPSTRTPRTRTPSTRTPRTRTPSTRAPVIRTRRMRAR